MEKMIISTVPSDLYKGSGWAGSACRFAAPPFRLHNGRPHFPRICRSWRSPSGIGAPLLKAIQTHCCILCV